MKTGSIYQTVLFKATPQKVYDLILNGEFHSDFKTGGVKTSRDLGGKFSVFNGYCRGYNIELVEGNKIIQAWNFEEDGWPHDHFSQCSFILSKNNNDCLLDFMQTNIPEHKVEALTQGWIDYYWEPLKMHIEGK